MINPSRFKTIALACAALVVSAYLGHLAYTSRDTLAMGIAAVATFATLVIWGIRAGATVTRLTVRSGQLEIVRQGGQMVFDLASHYTPVLVEGRLRQRSWETDGVPVRRLIPAPDHPTRAATSGLSSVSPATTSGTPVDSARWTAP